MIGLPPVPVIFLFALLSTVALVIWVTVVGRYLCELLPLRLRPTARFYLAPSLGLAFLTVLVSIIGRWLPLGSTAVAALIAIVPFAWSMVREPSKRKSLAHGFSNGVTSLAFGIGMLAPLLFYGGFNAHNDAFTYLAHSGWLQDHAFSDIIEPGLVTPLTTQVAMYQHFGFRMGGSFLIAFVQSIFHPQWAYSAYPSVIIAAVSSSCLSLGFPLAPFLRRFDRRTRLLALGLPAFSFGGLAFAANYGFLPQTLGMTFACSLLFLSGPTLMWLSSQGRGFTVASVKTALLSALLLSAATFAYSEFVPFIGLAIAFAALVTMVRTRRWWPVVAYGLAVLVFSLFLLNLEILRAYAALKLQSGAVVGTPVDWTLLGFLAHALGIHGGAWDEFQWTSPHAALVSYAVGLLATAILAALAAFNIRRLLGAARAPFLLPITVMLVILTVGLLYFRYGFASPFPIGTGQSWSQFKLADWAHPFLSVLVLLTLLLTVARKGGGTAKAVTALFVVGLFGAGAVAVERVRPVAKSYGNTRDLAAFYSEFSRAVSTACSPDVPVYLAFEDRDQKFRQIATLFLPDRQVLADWKGDDYVEAFLPESERHRELGAGQCIVERQSPDQVSSGGIDVGAFTVGLMPDKGRIRIRSVEGAHDEETNGDDWWRWVEREVSFQLQPLLVAGHAERMRVAFTFQTRGPQAITLVIETGEGSQRRQFSPVVIQSTGEAPAVFDQVLDVRPADIRWLHITTDGTASPLQAPDPRSAAWRIQNLRFEPVL